MYVNATQAANQQASTTRAVGGDLGKDAFLRILLAQMRNQDPLNPTDGAAMVAQLAQFSTLEQMQNLNEKLDSLVNLQLLGELSSLIGRRVSFLDGEGELQTGKVESILWRGDHSVLKVNEDAVLLGQIIEIGEGDVEDA
jgi:flagellar basal-body rod modification protein FlgD